MTPFDCEIVTSRQVSRRRPVTLDVCNLLQIASSALHLIEHQLDDEHRPLIHASLTAIRQIGGVIHAQPMRFAVPLTRSISQ